MVQLGFEELVCFELWFDDFCYARDTLFHNIQLVISIKLSSHSRMSM